MRNTYFKAAYDYVMDMKNETKRKISDAAKLNIIPIFDCSIKKLRVAYLFSNREDSKFLDWEEFCKIIEELECTNTIDYICKDIVRAYKKRKNANLKKNTH